MATRIIVAGCYRSGSTAIAAILHHLGVDMGSPFHGNHFESEEVASKLRAWWKEPLLEETTGKEERQAWLTDWVGKREQEGAEIVGVKHPLIGCRPEDFLEAWGDDLKVIWAKRPLDESVSSLRRLKWMEGYDEERIQSLLYSRISGFASNREHLAIENSSVKAIPQKEIGRLIDFLGLKPSAERRAAARDSLDATF